MSSDLQHQEAAGLLPAYVAGTLPDTQYAALIWHLRSCYRCSQEVKEWMLVGRAAQTALPPVLPDHRLLTAVQRRLPAAPSPWSPRRLFSLVWAQAPLVRQQIWTASALVLSLGLVTLLLG
ncbi:MAG TPA: zf-HC2 domain-containing protein, partial [Chloroflexota bacterium]|nr:zf-HC2 domain-containing protein [Chloroflexota bacterium]